MRNSVTIEDLAKHVLEKNTDVIFIDSCALLDIYRCLSRRNIPTSLARDAEELVSASENVIPNGRVSLVSADLCRHELADNASNVQSQVEVWLKRISKEYYIGLQAISNYVSTDFSKFVELHKSDAFRRVSDAYDNVARELHLCAPNKDVGANARARLVKRVPPGVKGGEYKDCELYETALSLKSALDFEGFSKQFVFVTSNTSDFCQKGVELKEPISSEMQSRKMEFATDLRWARSIIGI